LSLRQVAAVARLVRRHIQEMAQQDLAQQSARLLSVRETHQVGVALAVLAQHLMERTQTQTITIALVTAGLVLHQLFLIRLLLVT
jgi:hypothetical protein